MSDRPLDNFEPPGTGRPAPRLHWWKEVIYSAGFYALYSMTRNTQGSKKVGFEHAFGHARRLIEWEKTLHIFHEAWIQAQFLGSHAFIKFWNVYYGTAHFVITLLALVYCYRFLPRRYPQMRNTLACMTAVALIGFATFPLLPPRLLPTSYGFVDTLKTIGGLWNFDSGAVAKASNQFAAMPSLHFGWACWVTVTLWTWATTRVRRSLLLIYPFLTLFGIVVTGNHYFLDAAGGAIVFAAGLGLGTLITEAWARRGEPARSRSVVASVGDDVALRTHRTDSATRAQNIE